MFFFPQNGEWRKNHSTTFKELDTENIQKKSTKIDFQNLLPPEIIEQSFTLQEIHFLFFCKIIAKILFFSIFF